MRNELADELFGFSDSRARDWLIENLQRSERFVAFVSRYRNKIRKKIGSAQTDEDRDDIMAELEVALLLLTGFASDLEYERFGQGAGRSPDFTTSLGATDRNFEVKRIRQSSYERDVDQWTDKIATAIRSMPSDLSVGLHCHSLLEPFGLFAKLRKRTQETITFIEVIGRARSGHVRNEEQHTVPDTDGVLSVDLSPLPADRPSRNASFGGIFWPIGYTQREHHKFGDVICASLSQLRPSEQNILMITSNSLTHDDFDLQSGVASLLRLRDQTSDQFFAGKGFPNTASFSSAMSLLGAVWFRSSYISSERSRNEIWLNSEAVVSIPSDAASILETLNYP